MVILKIINSSHINNKYFIAKTNSDKIKQNYFSAMFLSTNVFCKWIAVMVCACILLNFAIPTYAYDDPTWYTTAAPESVTTKPTALVINIGSVNIKMDCQGAMKLASK